MKLNEFCERVKAGRYCEMVVEHNSTKVEFKGFESCCGIIFCKVVEWKRLSLNTLFDAIEELKRQDNWYSVIIWVNLPMEFLKERGLENSKVYSYHADDTKQPQVTVLEHHESYSQDYDEESGEYYHDEYVSDGLKNGWLAIAEGQEEYILRRYYKSLQTNLVCSFVNSKTGNDIELYRF